MNTSAKICFGAMVVLTSLGVLPASAETVAIFGAPDETLTEMPSRDHSAAFVSSGWYYTHIEEGTKIKVSGSYPRSGNGSISFDAPENGRADIEFVSGAALVDGSYVSTISLGAFSGLTSMSYDWYRSPLSSASPAQHPSLRVLLDRDGSLTTTNDRGGLIFERAYNNLATPVDQWVTDVVSANTRIWNTGFDFGSEFDIDFNGDAFDSNLFSWQAFLPDAAVIGFSAGVGGGWNSFSGAVDNISWTLNGVASTSNFELIPNEVSEPETLSLILSSLVALAMVNRREPR